MKLICRCLNLLTKGEGARKKRLYYVKSKGTTKFLKKVKTKNLLYEVTYILINYIKLEFFSFPKTVLKPTAFMITNSNVFDVCRKRMLFYLGRQTKLSQGTVWINKA